MSRDGREHGVRMGIGGVATSEMRQKQRQQHINRVVSDAYEFHKDPYMTTNDMGTIECRLCSTQHRSRENYMLHTEGKKHKENLSVRQYHINKAKARAEKNGPLASALNSLNPASAARPVIQKPRVGKPQCSVVRQYHPTEGFHSIAVKIEYPLIDKGLKPRYRVINPYEQNVENPDEGYQYLVFAAEPYNNIAVKIPNRPVDLTKIVRDWDPIKCEFLLQLKFKDDFNSKWRKQQELNLETPAVEGGADGAAS